MQKIILFAILLVIGSSCVDHTEKANFFLNEGLRELYTNNFSLAIENFDKAIKHDKNLHEAYYYRGSCKLNLGQYDEATIDYKKAIEIYPEYADAYYNLGLIKSTVTGDMTAGCEDWKKAAEYGKPNLESKLKFCN